MSGSPLISIITVVFNGAALLERTIRSVKNQTFQEFEYIIIDGASTDSTMEIVKQHSDVVDVVISEKDAGIYDAMNKGLSAAKGEYVLFMNAGDELFDRHTLNAVFSVSPGADVYYGFTAVVDEQGNTLGDRRLQPPAQLNWTSLRFGMCVSHQSFIARRALCPPYDLSFRISADIDWVIKVLKRSDRTVHTKMYISKFLEGGTSRQRMKKALRERFAIMTRHYGWLATIAAHIVILGRYPFHRLTRRSMT